jgi:hypothetical protein
VAEIDFDALWDKAFKPAIEKLGYDSVRADQDVGSLIINEMLERLYFSDLVLADMTIPNGNVHYEVGVRHACRDVGCVLLAADWSKQLFDVAQMRTVRYPLTAMPIDDAAASHIQGTLIAGIQPMLEGRSPIYAVLPGFPTAVDPQRATVMRREFEALTAFQARLSAVRAAPSGQQQALATQVMRDCEGTPLPPWPRIAFSSCSSISGRGSKSWTWPRGCRQMWPSNHPSPSSRVWPARSSGIISRRSPRCRR